ncbi:putative 2,5-diketo-D-gluconic acid reductase B [Colletotrichum sublineola]|uniref:Putative 2,5-diketo-D-gluconic acid reductase B n=1 Tax=Colletotrichum sublineola TaxID=1173701 RepID=A0A066XHH3_COLSU|nr:putative 2,5-diketo-D-gluconic acid reductase B [Colletotrichum sublineola]
MDERVMLPGTTATMPRVGLGVYQLRGEECYRACLAALEAGYRHIDTAQLYGNETEVGRAVKQYLQQQRSQTDGTAPTKREDIFLTTKIGRWNGGAGRTYRSALRSVQRVAGDDNHDDVNGDRYVDLFLVHRPVEERRELWAALGRLRSEGRIHPWCQQRELVEYCHAHGIVVQAYSPLARGRRMADPVLIAVVERVRHRLQDRDEAPSGGGGGQPGTGTGTKGRVAAAVTAAQVLVRWSLQRGLVPLPKSGEVTRIRENADVWRFALDEEEMAMLDGLDMGAEGALFPTNVS